MTELQDQAIAQHCKALRRPTIGMQFARMADAALREGQSHLGCLEALLSAEMEERESRAVARLLHEARLPRMKTLDEFEFDRSGVSAAPLRDLATGDYVAKVEPVLLVGEAGTGGGRKVPSARPMEDRPEGRRIWRRACVLPLAGSGAGFGSRPPRR